MEFNDSTAVNFPLSKEEAIAFTDKAVFAENALIPVVVQEYRSKSVLMLAYMNRESLIETLTSGKMTYYSRSRKSLWLKGETSGAFQIVKEAYLDCDSDTLLFKVLQQADGACHTGQYSCFFKGVKDNRLTESEKYNLFLHNLFNNLDKIQKSSCIKEFVDEVALRAEKINKREESTKEAAKMFLSFIAFVKENGINASDLEKEIWSSS